jgi:gas vesicle protein
VGRAERPAAKAERKAAKMAAKRKHRGGFLIGAIAGVAIGLLLAPKSGKDTRAQLFGEGGIGSQVDRLKGAVGAGKDSAADQSEALKRKIEETRERLRRQMDGGGEDAAGDGSPVE